MNRHLAQTLLRQLRRDLEQPGTMDRTELVHAIDAIQALLDRAPQPPGEAWRTPWTCGTQPWRSR